MFLPFLESLTTVVLSSQTAGVELLNPKLGEGVRIQNKRDE